MKQLSLLIIIILALCACSEMTMVRQHPNLNQKLNEIDSVTIIPTQVSIYEKTVSGRKTLQSQASEHAMKALFLSALQILQDHGFEVVKFTRPKNTNGEIQQENTIRAIRDAFQRFEKKVRLRTSEELDIARNMNESILLTPGHWQHISQAEHFLLMDFVGYQKSASAFISSGLVSGLDLSGLESGYLKLALVNAQTGAILWATSRHTNDANDFELLQRAMKHFPLKRQSSRNKISN